VISVDHCESLTLLDDWIRQVLLGSVPDTCDRAARAEA
jgi:hypothetical protein